MGASQPPATRPSKFRVFLHKWMPGLLSPTEAEVLKMHKELREHERELKTLFFNASIGMSRFSSQGVFVEVNDNLAAMLGYTREEMEGKMTLEAVCHPNDLPEETANFQKLVKGEIDTYSMVKRKQRKDGGYIWVRQTVSAIKDGHGSLDDFISVVQDITGQVKAEKEALENLRWFELLANAIPQLAWMADAEGNLIWFSDKWYEYTGETWETLKGGGWMGVHDPAELPRVLEGFKRAVAEKSEWEDIFALRRRDGQMRPHLSRARPGFTENGEVEMWFGTNTDITEIQQAEAAANAASRAKDRFIAVLSHELRTPLTPVLSGVDILENEMGKETLSAPALDALNMIRHNVRLEATLIDDLLDLTTSRAKKLKLELNPTDFYEVLNRSFQAFSTKIRAKQIRVRQKLEAGDSFVLGHAPRLHQIVSNLLGNAVKFTPDKGEICIHVSDADGFLAVEIKDNGIGIEPGVIDRIFEPFEQHERKAGGGYGGLGLGLTIAKNLTVLHNGQISAHSEGPGKGATVVLKLPKAERPSDAMPSPPMPVMAVDPNKARVLLVEDHRDTLRSMAFLIRQLGYEVQTASTVKEAEMHALEGDILVSDIGLPDGNGYGLMRTLRKRGIRGIAVSGFGQEEDIDRSREAGFSKHLVKPVDRRILEQTLRQVVATRYPDWLS